MSFDLLDRIDAQSAGFTKILTKIADYVKREYMRIPFLSIQEISHECDVSATSIHRFCKSVDYAGYSELQKEIQNLMRQELTIKETETYREWGSAEDGILKKQIDFNIQVLQEMYTGELNANFVKAAVLIKSARRVYVLGLRESYATAFYLYYLLGDYMDNITLLSLGADDIYDRISNLNGGDLLVAVGFKAYTKYTVDIIRHFRSQGSATVALTDLHSSPLAIHADVCLIPGNKTPSYGNVMAITIIKALAMEVLSLYKAEEIDEFSRQKEDLLKTKDIYLK